MTCEFVHIHWLIDAVETNAGADDVEPRRCVGNDGETPTADIGYVADTLLARVWHSGKRGDPKGRRIEKWVESKYERGWVYDDGLRILAELREDEGQLVVWSRFFYATQSHSPDLMWEVQTEKWYRFVKDVRGSIRAVVDVENGNVAQQID